MLKHINLENAIQYQQSFIYLAEIFLDKFYIPFILTNNYQYLLNELSN